MSPIPNYDAMDVNKKGRLTPSQAVGLIPLILLGGVFFLIGVFISGGIIYALISHTFKGSLLAAVIFGGTISLMFFIFAYLLGGTRLIDLVIGQVRHVEGQAIRATERSMSRGGGVSIIRYYAVGEQHFQIWSKKTHKALPEFVMVRAYYTPLSKTLVNVEHVYSQSGMPESAFGRDQELGGLQKLGKAEIEAKKQKND
jgi:hypothetical protein